MTVPWPTFALPAIQRVLAPMLELPELLKPGTGIGGQANITGGKGIILFTGRKIHDPANRIQQLRLDLRDFIGQAMEARLLRPREQNPSMHPVTIAFK